MSNLVRFGVSLEEGLLKQFDGLIRRNGYTNRSEAIRDLIRNELVDREWQMEEVVVGVVMIVYNHHQRELQPKITDLQHHYGSQIISSQHIHLDRHNCLEVVIVRGRAGVIRELAGRLKAIRGIKHCSLSMSTTAKGIV